VTSGSGPIAGRATPARAAGPGRARTILLAMALLAVICPAQASDLLVSS
jgi:hypothetical protein